MAEVRKGKKLKALFSNDATVFQPGEIKDNPALTKEARKQGSKGAESTRQGKANYSGEVQPTGSNPRQRYTVAGKKVEPSKPSLGGMGVASADYTIGGQTVYDIDALEAGGLRAEGGGKFGTALDRGAYRQLPGTRSAVEVPRGGDQPIAAGGGQPPEGLPMESTEWDDYDASVEGMHGAFNRDPSEQPGTPPIGSGYSDVANAPGAFKRTYQREDGTTGTEYTNVPEGVAPSGVGSLTGLGSAGGGVGAGDPIGPNYAQSEGLSQINADISKLLGGGGGQQGQPEVSFEQLMSYNNANKVEERTNKERVRLRHSLASGKISGRRYSEAVHNLGKENLAAKELATGYRSKPSEMLSAQAQMRGASAAETAAGSKGGAVRYAADVGRQTKLDELFGADVTSARETAGGMNEATMGALGKILSNPDGIALIDEMGGIGAFLSKLGAGSGGSKRNELEAARAANKG